MENRGIQNYRDLGVWQKAIALSVACYRVTSEFPKEEMYGMTAQIRRASVSVAANIAEGHGREHTRTFVQFLRISQGSLKELETHLILAEQVGLSDLGNGATAVCILRRSRSYAASPDQIPASQNGRGRVSHPLLRPHPYSLLPIRYSLCDTVL